MLIDVNQLTHTRKPYIVEDSIEGWCDVADAVISSFFEGNEHSGIRYDVDYSQVRPKGAPLSHGGKAPGPEGLEQAIEKLRQVFIKRIQNGRRKFRSIDVYDVLCHLSDAVLSGGVRRSASICLFDMEDELMLNAKTGNWFAENPQRARSNNSVVIIKGTITREKFHMMIDTIRQFGEPGFIFLDHPDFLYNPCVEIGMCPVAIYRPDKERVHKLPEKYQAYCKTTKGFKGPLVENYTLEILNEREKFERYGFRYESGWQTCNLTEINGKAIQSRQDFERAVRSASIVGTCQAGYIKHGYLALASQHIIERESLLGVSMTGVQDSPEFTLNAELQREMAQIVADVNRWFAPLLGINIAARTTCVKPAGNSSVLLECASGIHPHHARRFFRRVQVNKQDNVLQHFKDLNRDMIEESVWSATKADDVITFPIDVGAKANIKADLSAKEFLDHVRLTQDNWVYHGVSRPASTEMLMHNVSNTVNVRDEEWEIVADYLFDYQTSFSGISLLSSSGDKVYNQAPMEACFFESELIELYGEKTVKHAQRLYKRIVKKLHVDNIQEVRYKFTSLALLNGSFTRKFEWVLENCKPLMDDDGELMEDKYEFEARCSNEYITTLAIYRDMRKSIKIENINTVLDLIASAVDEERWNELVKSFKKVDYSTMIEEEDVTDLQGEQACAGGACEVSFDVGKKDKKDKKETTV
jgi:ribonucleoside-diphosphate reductase alpha chain